MYKTCYKCKQQLKLFPTVVNSKERLVCRNCIRNMRSPVNTFSRPNLSTRRRKSLPGQATFLEDE